jgi:hypothetical protein
MEKMTEEIIAFVKEWIAAHGATADLEKLLHGLEHERALRYEFVPGEILHDLLGSNVGPIPMGDVPRYQEAYPAYDDHEALATRGAAVLASAGGGLKCTPNNNYFRCGRWHTHHSR